METETVTLAELADAFSARLEVARMTVSPLVSSEYQDETFNGRSVLRLELREEFRDLIDMQEELYSQEFAVLNAVEKETGEKFCHDDFGYSWPEHLGEYGINHFLVDMDAAAEILAALERHPLVSDERRLELIDEIKNPI